MAMEGLTLELLKALPADGRREFAAMVNEARAVAGIRPRLGRAACMENPAELVGLLAGLSPRQRAYLRGSALGLYLKRMLRGECAPLVPATLPRVFEN